MTVESWFLACTGYVLTRGSCETIWVDQWVHILRKLWWLQWQLSITSSVDLCHFNLCALRAFLDLLSLQLCNLHPLFRRWTERFAFSQSDPSHIVPTWHDGEKSRKKIIKVQAMLRWGKREERKDSASYAVTLSFLARSRQKILLPTSINH